MSNLSLARIMYGSNEDSTVSGWMQSSSKPSQLPNSLSISGGSSYNWMHRLISAVIHYHDGNTPDSPKGNS